MEILSFLKKSVNHHFAVQTLEELLKNHNFTKLEENQAWDLSLQKGYYFIKGASIIAFYLPLKSKRSYPFRLWTAHTDSPVFKLRNNFLLSREGYEELNVEAYGGIMNYSWFDRDLSIAGKVLYKNLQTNKIESKLINFKKPLLSIPTPAVHLHRSLNTNIKQEEHLHPIYATTEKSKDFQMALCNKLEIEKEQILAFDLNFVRYKWTKSFGN